MPNGPNGKFRHRKTNFAQISNTALQDKRLSLKAKGLYSMIQSYLTIPNYDLYKWSLIKQCKEGEKAFDSAWRELKDCGYLKQYRIPGGERGRFCYEYELLDVADETNPATVNLNRSGEVVPQKKDESDHTPPKGVYGQMDDSVPDHTPHLAPYLEKLGYTVEEQGSIAKYLVVFKNRLPIGFIMPDLSVRLISEAADQDNIQKIVDFVRHNSHLQSVGGSEYLLAVFKGSQLTTFYNVKNQTVSYAVYISNSESGEVKQNRYEQYDIASYFFATQSGLIRAEQLKMRHPTIGDRIRGKLLDYLLSKLQERAVQR